MLLSRHSQLAITPVFGMQGPLATTVLPRRRAGIRPANSTVASSRMANCTQKGNQMADPHVASYCHLPLLSGVLTLRQYEHIHTTCLIMLNQICCQLCAKRRGEKKSICKHLGGRNDMTIGYDSYK